MIIPLSRLKAEMSESHLELFTRIAKGDIPQTMDSDYSWLKGQKLVSYWRMEDPPVFLTPRGEKLKSLLEEGT